MDLIWLCGTVPFLGHVYQIEGLGFNLGILTQFIHQLTIVQLLLLSLWLLVLQICMEVKLVTADYFSCILNQTLQSRYLYIFNSYGKHWCAMLHALQQQFSLGKWQEGEQQWSWKGTAEAGVVFGTSRMRFTFHYSFSLWPNNLVLEVSKVQHCLSKHCILLLESHWQPRLMYLFWGLHHGLPLKITP